VKKAEEEDEDEERKQEGKREDGRLFRKLGSRDIPLTRACFERNRGQVISVHHYLEKSGLALRPLGPDQSRIAEPMKVK